MKREKFMYDTRNYDYTAGIVTGIGINSGEIYWEMTPGTAPASASGMYIAEFLAMGSTSVFARIAFTGASSITLTYADAKGHTGTGAYNTTSNLTSGTSYQCKLAYTPESFDFYINNTACCSIAGDVDWGGEPLVLAYWGVSSGSSGTYTSTTYSKPTMDTYKY